jgi:kynureninase
MTQIPHPDLEEWRAEFPILESSTYLNSCSLGPLSHRSERYLEEYRELWHSMGASAWYEKWIGRIEELRARVARLWNAQEREVGLTHSVSVALSSIASAVDYGKRNRVVVADLDFPTIAYQWMVKPGVELVRVPSDDGITVPAERWAEYVDERTAIVATSHVFYGTGYIQDIPAIGRVARDAGALFVVDGYQAMGQLPVDPRALGADVYVAGPLKWMLGGPGLAYLWVRNERIRELHPTITSWFAAKDQFRFGIGDFEFRDDAQRFAMGTPAIPTMYTALGGAEIVLDVGPERIRERNAALTEDLIARVRSELGAEMRIAPDAAERSAIVMVRMDDAPGAVARLAQSGIIVDHRAGHVRISPHFYNTPEENARVVDTLRGL